MVVPSSSVFSGRGLSSGSVFGSMWRDVWAEAVPRWWSDAVVASVSPDGGGPQAAGLGWSCCVACWDVGNAVAGCARGAFGDLGVSFVASALPVGGVCCMVAESGSRMSAVRFCPERCMGVFGGVRNVVVSACVLSAEL